MKAVTVTALLISFDDKLSVQLIDGDQPIITPEALGKRTFRRVSEIFVNTTPIYVECEPCDKST